MGNTNIVHSKLSSLKAIYEIFKEENKLSVSTVFSLNGLHSDYAKLLNDDEVLIRTVGGKRGPGRYKWVGPKPSIGMAKSLINRFNAIRANNNLKANSCRKTNLLEISHKLDLIIKHLKIDKP